MRLILRALILAAPFALAACGGTTERTYVVNPPAAQTQTTAPSTTVVTPNDGTAVKVCPEGATSC